MRSEGGWDGASKVQGATGPLRRFRCCTTTFRISQCGTFIHRSKVIYHHFIPQLGTSTEGVQLGTWDSDNNHITTTNTMPPRPALPKCKLALDRLISPAFTDYPALTSRLTAVRHLQTTAPLPPPTTPLPPIASSSTSASTSTSATTTSTPAKSASIFHLPPIIPYNKTSHLSTLPTSVPEAISLLRTQSTESSGIYCIARLHSRTFLLHPRDILTLPTLKPLQPPGTTLKLTRIQEVGCRDYAIRAPSADGKILRKTMDWDSRALPNIPTEIAECELTILEHTRSPQEIRFKMKRRKGYRRTIKAKHGWTRLRVGDIKLGLGSSSGMELGKPSP